jgi:type VI secretion system protein ImpA
MATPSVLAVEDFLAPIAPDRPSGRELTYEPEYDEIREARRSEDSAPQGDWKRKPKVADWERVIELGTALLRGESKDVQVAAWVAEALARRHGLAGLRDGLRLVRAIQDAFWETYYPQIEDGDLESRSGPFTFLNGVLPTVVRTTRLTEGPAEGPYSFLRWQESRATDNVGLKNPELMDALIAEGKITSKQFDDEVALTPRAFYEALDDDLRECAAALQDLDRSNDQHFGRDAPSLVGLRKALDDLRSPLLPILQAKREQEPDAEAVEDEPEGEAESEGWDASSVATAPTPKRTRARRPSGGVLDARQKIVEAAEELRRDEPASPIPFLVVRALRMGELYAQSSPPDASQCAAPSSETRQMLRRLASEGDWAGLLEQAEEAIGRPEGCAWLDAHRYALVAMASGDVDRSAAARAARSLLRAVLGDFPELAEAELGDGTPTANAETRAWLKEEGLTGPASGTSAMAYEPPFSAATSASAGAEEASDAPPDVWDEALAMARGGRAAEGVERLRRAMNAAANGRERFVRKLQMAELCLLSNRPRVALPLAEDLARQIDEFHLEQWEDDQLCARAWAALYRCLRHAGDDNGAAERTQHVFTRLCRLDINQAMMYDEDRARP